MAAKSPQCSPHACVQVFRQRIIQLETINVELEHRLEKQAKERMELEHEGAENEARWEMKRIDLIKARACLGL